MDSAIGQVSVPLVTSNRINTPEVGETLLAEGAADMVSMARPFLADPDFVAKAAAGRADEIAPCIACTPGLPRPHLRRQDLLLPGQSAGLPRDRDRAHRPRHGPNASPLSAPARPALPRRSRQPGGVSAVTLFDKADRVGGQLHLAAAVPGKEEFRGLIRWFEVMVAKAEVAVRLGVEAGPEDVRGFDEVIVATGVTPRDPGIPVTPGARVLSYVEVLRGAEVGARVAIVGAGGIGFDVAEFLTHAGESPAENLDLWRAEWGVADPAKKRGGITDPRPAPSPRKVVLLQRKARALGKGLGKTTGWIHRASLRAKGVEMVGGVSYAAIDADGLHLLTGDGPRVVAADTVVICAGQEPARGLAEALEAQGFAPHLIGGADIAAELDAKRAIRQGVRLAATL